MKDVYKKLADAVTNNPLPISIKSETTSEVRKFVILQPSFGILIHVSGLLSEIRLEDLKSIFESKNIIKYINQYGNTIIEVVSIILDRRIDYTKDTFEFIRDNLTAYELYDLLTNIVLRIGVQDFQKSIIATTSMSLLRQREIIALAKKSSIPLNL